MVNVALNKTLMTLVVIGLLLGLALSGSDLANFITNSAKAHRIQVETEQLVQQSEIDMGQYEIVQEARTQAELERLEDETRYLRWIREQEAQHQRQVHELELRQRQEQNALESKLFQLAGFVAIAVIGLSLLVLSVGFSMRIVRRPAGTLAARPIGHDVWSPERRRQERLAARRCEIISPREIEMTEKQRQQERDSIKVHPILSESATETLVWDNVISTVDNPTLAGSLVCNGKQREPIKFEDATRVGEQEP